MTATATDIGPRTLVAAELPDYGLRPTPVPALVDAAGADVLEIDDPTDRLVGYAAIHEQQVVLVLPAGQAEHRREVVIRQMLAELSSSADLRGACPALARLATTATVTDFGRIPTPFDNTVGGGR